ncbi:ATP-binding protein [Streptomyces sp. NPDC021749]|uniref:ATP-binding protein n=1 Tax=Streptomyces siderophoricus TaxID=2802281 RepID=A0ABS1MYW2_9ACTN|nr:ATP-binding protein [Streptomyces sp. 9-7]MBL1092962.1 ATP-binding protein [Streptomyces sp. 9-7]
MEAQQFTLSVPGTPAAAAVARRKLVSELEGWGVGLAADVLDTAQLLVSELITNAVQHVGVGPVSVTARLASSALRIEVDDTSAVLPQPVVLDEEAEGGRGLVLVAALADRHGAEPTPAGKRCWAEISLRQARSPCPATPPPLPAAPCLHPRSYQ